jgi:hypothetical protein
MSQVSASPLPIQEGCLKWPVRQRRGARDRNRWVARAGGGPGASRLTGPAAVNAVNIAEEIVVAMSNEVTSATAPAT